MFTEHSLCLHTLLKLLVHLDASLGTPSTGSEGLHSVLEFLSRLCEVVGSKEAPSECLLNEEG